VEYDDDTEGANVKQCLMYLTGYQFSRVTDLYQKLPSDLKTQCESIAVKFSRHSMAVPCVTHELLQRVITYLKLKTTPLQDTELRKLFQQPVQDLMPRSVQDEELVPVDEKGEVKESTRDTERVRMPDAPSALSNLVPYSELLLGDFSEAKARLLTMLIELQHKQIESDLKLKAMALEHEREKRKYQRTVANGRRQSDAIYAQLLSLPTIQKSKNIHKLLADAIMHNVDAEHDSRANFAADVTDIYLDVCGVSLPDERAREVKEYVRQKYAETFQANPARWKKWEAGGIVLVDRYPAAKERWIKEIIQAKYTT